MKTNVNVLPKTVGTIYLDIETFGPTAAPQWLHDIAPEGIRVPADHGGLSLSNGTIAVVSVACDDRPVDVFEYRKMDDPQRKCLLDFIMEAPSLVGHNIGFDLSFLMKEARRLGVPIPVVEPVVIDTMHLGRLAHAQAVAVPNPSGPGTVARRDSLAWLAEYHLGITMDKSQQNADWSGPISLEMVQYARNDVLVVRKLLTESLQHVLTTYSEVVEFEGDAVWNAAKMAARGFPVNAPALLKLTSNLCDEYTARLTTFRQQTGLPKAEPNTFGKYLHDQGIDLPRHENGPGYKCSKELLHLFKDDHPSIAVYMEVLRLKQHIDKALGLILGIDAESFRIHALWSAWSAPSGRMAASKPNLLGLPKGLRGPFALPDTEPPLVIADLSQIQVRVVAKFSGCNMLTSQYENGGDVHRALAAQIHGVAQEDVTSAQRSKAKAGTFGFLFGCGVDTFIMSQLRDGTLMDPDEAEAIKQSFGDAFPGVVHWQRNGFNTAKRHRGRFQGKTLGGIPYTAKTGNEVLNYPVQAVDAVIVKQFLAEAEGRGWETVCVIHDEVVVAGASAREVQSLLEEIGSIVLEFPVEADADERQSWAA